MGIEYIAAIAEEDYEAFKIIVTTTLPCDYEMWLRVRERGRVRALEQRAVVPKSESIRRNFMLIA